MPKSSKRARPCAYCPNLASGTVDHVPPRCFFTRPRPAQTITVPACSSCNGRFGSEQDEIVRNVLHALRETEGHRAQRALAGKVERSIQRSPSVMARIGGMIRVFPGGAGQAAAGVIDLEIDPVLGQFMERMTRALLTHESKVGFLPGTVRWKKRPAGETLLPMAEARQLEPLARCGEIGDSFEYVGFLKDPERCASLWFMCFYDGPVFECLFTPDEVGEGCSARVPLSSGSGIE